VAGAFSVGLASGFESAGFVFEAEFAAGLSSDAVFVPEQPKSPIRVNEARTHNDSFIIRI
jgi:hypothetical protein